jgi:hypothetical protein
MKQTASVDSEDSSSSLQHDPAERITKNSPIHTSVTTVLSVDPASVASVTNNRTSSSSHQHDVETKRPASHSSQNDGKVSPSALNGKVQAKSSAKAPGSGKEEGDDRKPEKPSRSATEKDPLRKGKWVVSIFIGRPPAAGMK